MGFYSTKKSLRIMNFKSRRFSFKFLIQIQLYFEIWRQNTYSTSVLKFAIIKWSHRLLIEYLNHQIELTLSEKFQSPLVPLIVKIKHNIGSAIKHSKQIAHPKPKVCLLKNALKNVEEVKGANEIKQIISIWISSPLS